MDTKCFKIRIIFILFVNYIANNINCQNISKTLKEQSLKISNQNSPINGINDNDSICNGKKCFNYWIATMGTINPDLLNVQAIVVKDEDVGSDCGAADRKSVRRYLMCAGSILNRNHVLTSASCIHTATHIRHNIRGTFAVAIAPLKINMQVIRVEEYKIHPEHDTNPYSPKHLTHNVAILKLGCRIERDNFFKIELPQAPFMQVCSDDNCIVALYRNLRRTRWAMSEAMAPNVPYLNRRRKETMIEDEESQKNVKYEKNGMQYSRNIRTKRTLVESPLIIDENELATKINKSEKNWKNLTTVLETQHLLVEKPIEKLDLVKNSILLEQTISNDEEYQDWLRSGEKRNLRSFAVRSVDGHRGCSQTGAPVMFNKIQSALVAVSCDDRQSSRKWGYTDLYENLDWIHNILQDWNGSVNTSGGMEGSGNGSCSTCIFNFFIEIGCKDKDQCGNKSVIADSKKLQKFHQFENSRRLEKNKKEDCAGPLGIGMGQDCRKTKENLDNRSNYKESFRKSWNPRIPESLRSKNWQHARINDNLGPQRPIGMLRSNIFQNQREVKNEYFRKNNPRVWNPPRRIIPRPSSQMSKYKLSKIDNKNSMGFNNTIGFPNIRVGESVRWQNQNIGRLVN